MLNGFGLTLFTWALQSNHTLADYMITDRQQPSEEAEEVWNSYKNVWEVKVFDCDRITLK